MYKNICIYDNSNHQKFGFVWIVIFFQKFFLNIFMNLFFQSLFIHQIVGVHFYVIIFYMNKYASYFVVSKDYGTTNSSLSLTKFELTKLVLHFPEGRPDKWVLVKAENWQAQKKPELRSNLVAQHWTYVGAFFLPKTGALLNSVMLTWL